MFCKIENQFNYSSLIESELFYVKTIKILLKFTSYLISPLLILGSYFYFVTGYTLFGFMELSLGLFIQLLVYIRYLDIYKKKNIILITFYIASYFILITTGIAGGGLTSIFVSTIFIGLLTRRTKTIWVLISVNTFVMLTITTLLFLGVLDNYMISTYKNTWLLLLILISIYIVGTLFAIVFYKDTIQNQFISINQKRDYLREIVNVIDDSIITIDDNGIILLSNHSFERIFNQGESVVGMNYFNLIDQFLDVNNTSHTLLSSFDNKLTEGDYSISVNGEKKYFNRSVFSFFNSKGKEERLIKLMDITERKRSEDKLHHLSFHDQLTGLYNRHFFETELSRLNKTRSLPLSLLLIDVNGLKLINDSFGHITGDAYLKETANCLSSSFREVDIISRIGGDEFTVILPNTSNQDAKVLASRVNQAAKNITVNGIRLSFAIGVGTKDHPDQLMDDILRKLEDNLYQNKILESQSMRSHTINLILQTLYEKNNREMLHSKRVSVLSAALAEALNLEVEIINEIKIAGLMHDIGKIGIEEAILNKPEALSNSEWQKMKQHSEIGYRILNSVVEFSSIAKLVLQHHENVDGTGYPHNLSHDDILLGAKIIRIADSYDAMTGQRPYNFPMTKEDAIQELIKFSGSSFDHNLVQTFIENVVDKEKNYT